MEFDIEIFRYAIERNEDNDLLDMWKIQNTDNMQLPEHMSFKDFKAELIEKQINSTHTNISYEEIETEMEKVMKAFEKKEVK